ncbi:hypothetical protein ACFO5K_04135 [Nocardia halotolerans]|uniref:Uncharacterized protein n=1 Tax=Nocardia halotolerans TaxID=1755878 RepID=A0ABV8VCG8_9NOCA
MTEALDRLRAATKRFESLNERVEKARQEVIEAVVTALREGELPTEVAEASPYKPSHVRKIARDNGIEPARPGLKRRK